MEAISVIRGLQIFMSIIRNASKRIMHWILNDLLVKMVDLFQTNPDVLEHYQDRFQYIMVDEYQDTNTVQFLL